MSLKEDISNKIEDYFDGIYTVTNGRSVPSADNVGLGKVGVSIEIAMMFVDIRESTKIVGGLRRISAARMYKSFLWAVTKIVKHHGGEVKSFNGDGVLAVFEGDYKCNQAAKAAYMINWMVIHSLRPQMESYFKRNNSLQDVNFGFGLGIDVGDVLIVRAGLKGADNSDLVWAGNATNLAVKLSDIGGKDNPIYISNRVYNKLDDTQKKFLDGTTSVWEKRRWVAQNDAIVYCTNYWRA